MAYHNFKYVLQIWALSMPRWYRLLLYSLSLLLYTPFLFSKIKLLKEHFSLKPSSLPLVLLFQCINTLPFFFFFFFIATTLFSLSSDPFILFTPFTPSISCSGLSLLLFAQSLALVLVFFHPSYFKLFQPKISLKVI